LNLPDLRRTLHQALGSGRVGIPVALRLHLRLEKTGAANADLVSAAAVLMSWGEQVFGSPPRDVAVSQSRDESLTILATCAGGQMIHVTVAAAERAELHLLLVGNRGIVRLEGGELFEAASVEVEVSHAQEQWAERIRRSRDAGGSLTTGAVS
jgi:hypothetical protein